MDKNIKEIPGYPGYYVSKDGEVFSSVTHLNTHTYNDVPKTPDKLKKLYIRIQVKSNLKYKYATVRLNRYHKKIKVSRLVALAWVPNLYPNDFNMVCHIDNNPLNNKAENLYWGNGKLNMTQCSMDGRLNSKPPILKGESNGFSKYSNKLINKVFRFHRRNPTYGYKSLSKLFNIKSISTIRKIIKGTHGGLLPRYQRVPLTL